jgi:hypothetical protein
MKRPESQPPEGRDQDPTTFAEILQELLWQEPRATAAVLIDSEGETVDYATSLPSYYTKVAAAYLRIVLDDMGGGWRDIASGYSLTQALIRARLRSFFVRPLTDGYALVLILRRRAFAVSGRAVSLAVCRLAKEARWPSPAEETLAWHPADVESSRADHFRPKQMKTGDAWEPVEVLGSVVRRAGEAGPPKERGEKGYRCRLQGGAEVTLVREPTGVWFVDQPSRGLSSRLGPESVPPGRPESRPAPNESPRTSRRAPLAASESPRSSSHGSPRASSSQAPSTPNQTRRRPSGKAPPSPPTEAPEITDAIERTPPSDSLDPSRVGTSSPTGDMWAKEAKRARKI